MVGPAGRYADAQSAAFTERMSLYFVREWEVRTNMKTESDAPPLTSSIGCHVTHVPQGGSSPKPGDPTYTDAEWWTAPQLFGPVATALDATLVLNSTDPLSSGLDAATQAALVAASTLTEAVPGTAVAQL